MQVCRTDALYSSRTSWISTPVAWGLASKNWHKTSDKTKSHSRLVLQCDYQLSSTLSLNVENTWMAHNLQVFSLKTLEPSCRPLPDWEYSLVHTLLSDNQHPAASAGYAKDEWRPCYSWGCGKQDRILGQAGKVSRNRMKSCYNSRLPVCNSTYTICLIQKHLHQKTEGWRRAKVGQRVQSDQGSCWSSACRLSILLCYRRVREIDHTGHYKQDCQRYQESGDSWWISHSISCNRYKLMSV